MEDGQAELAHEAWLQQFPVDVWSTVTAKASRRHWVIMVALCNRANHYIFALLFLSIFFFFSSPNLSDRRLDVYHTLTHGVALVRIYNAGLKDAARGSLQMQDPKKSQKSPSGHHRTTLLGYIFATKARIDNRKKTC